MEDAGLGALVPGLATGTCALTLQTLDLVEGEITGGPGLTALGQALGKGRSPALVELNLSDNPIQPGGMEEFMAALMAAGAPPLKTLKLYGTRMGDRGVMALAAAYREGRLGSQLRELRLGRFENRNGAPVTYSGCLALLEAFMEGQMCVRRLHTVSCNVATDSASQVEELIVAFVLGCPAIGYLELGTNLANVNRATVLAAAEKR